MWLPKRWQMKVLDIALSTMPVDRAQPLSAMSCDVLAGSQKKEQSQDLNPDTLKRNVDMPSIILTHLKLAIPTPTFNAYYLHDLSFCPFSFKLKLHVHCVFYVQRECRYRIYRTYTNIFIFNVSIYIYIYSVYMQNVVRVHFFKICFDTTVVQLGHSV